MDFRHIGLQGFDLSARIRPPTILWISYLLDGYAKKIDCETMNKQEWCEYGLKWEKFFVKHITHLHGLHAIMNPDKDENPYAPDLIVNGQLADLKHQTTPFFTADNPQYTVTLNKKDRDRYERLYPDIVIYFWVIWTTLEWYDIVVQPLSGVWRTTLKDIEFTDLHWYNERTKENAQSSYLLDLRSFEKL